MDLDGWSRSGGARFRGCIDDQWRELQLVALGERRNGGCMRCMRLGCVPRTIVDTRSVRHLRSCRAWINDRSAAPILAPAALASVSSVTCDPCDCRVETCGQDRGWEPILRPTCLAGSLKRRTETLGIPSLSRRLGSSGSFGPRAETGLRSARRAGSTPSRTPPTRPTR